MAGIKITATMPPLPNPTNRYSMLTFTNNTPHHPNNSNYLRSHHAPPISYIQKISQSDEHLQLIQKSYPQLPPFN